MEAEPLLADRDDRGRGASDAGWLHARKGEKHLCRPPNRTAGLGAPTCGRRPSGYDGVADTHRRTNILLDHDTALAEFAATAAALNARALHRAGLLDDLERGTMHVLLDFVERIAESDGDENHQSLVRSIRQCLPPETTTP